MSSSCIYVLSVKFLSVSQQFKNYRTQFNSLMKVPRIPIEKISKTHRKPNTCKDVVCPEKYRKKGVKKRFQTHYREDVERKQASHEKKLRKLFLNDKARWTRLIRSVELKGGFAYFRAVESALKRVSPKMKHKVCSIAKPENSLSLSPSLSLSLLTQPTHPLTYPELSNISRKILERENQGQRRI